MRKMWDAIWQFDGTMLLRGDYWTSGAANVAAPSEDQGQPAERKSAFRWNRHAPLWVNLLNMATRNSDR
jgi:hypothetical protein